MIRLKISEKDKTDKWFDEVKDYYLPRLNTTGLDEFTDEQLSLYELMNNDLSSFQDTLNDMCNSTLQFGGAPDELLAYNKIRNKFEILTGDLIRRGNNHHIILMTAKAIRNKETKMLEALRRAVDQDLKLAIDRVQEEMHGKTQAQIDQWISQYRSELMPTDINYRTFTTDIEMYKNKMLKYIYHEQDVMNKKIQTFRHQGIVDGFISYNGWMHGRPFIKACNPPFTRWLKSNDQQFVQESDVVIYKDSITLGSAISEYGNSLSDKKLKEIFESNYYGTALSKDHWTKPIMDKATHEFTWGMSRGRFSSERFKGMFEDPLFNGSDQMDKFDRTHMEFKAFQEVIFWSYKDEYGDRITVELSDAADIVPDHAQRVEFTNSYFQKDYKYVWDGKNGTNEARVLWVPQRYESLLIGDISLYNRKVPLQPSYANRPIDRFELSYKGGFVNSLNAKPLSLLQEALPFYFQILIAKKLQNKEMSKYQGFVVAKDADQIPEDLAKDQEGNIMEGVDKLSQQEVIQRNDGTIWYSRSEGQTGLQMPASSLPVNVYQMGNALEFINLQNFINLIDNELGIAIGVPAPREGQVVSNTNVRDNLNAQTQGTVRTEYHYWWHSKVWSHILNEHLYNMDTFFRLWFERHPGEKEHLLEYMLPDYSKEVIRVLPKYLHNSDIGMFLNDSSSDKAYMEFMINYGLQPIAQNAGEGAKSLSTIMRAITSGESAEEVHRKILQMADEQEKRAQQMQEQQQNMLAQQIQANKELAESEYAKKMEFMLAQKIEDRLTKLQVEDISSERFARQKDIDENKLSDDIQKAQIQIEADKEMAADKMAHEKQMQKEKLSTEKDLKRMDVNSRKGGS